MESQGQVQLPTANLKTINIRAKEKHPDWSRARLELAEHEYRRFLALCKANPSKKISPSSDVDEIWHLHILDTAKYAKDCNEYFGYFLHHEACIGDADVESMLETMSLYEKIFGEKPSLEWQRSVASTCANPGGGCGSVRIM